MCEDLAVAQSARPALPTHSLLDDVEARLSPNARFEVVRSRCTPAEGKVREVVGRWLPLREARRVAELMSRRYAEINPWRGFGEDRWDIERHRLPWVSCGKVSAGDVVLHKVTEAWGDFVLSENSVATEYEAICRVSETDAVGRPVAGVDLLGHRASIRARKYQVLDQGAIDVDAAFDAMRAYRAMLPDDYSAAAFFSACQRFLTDALHPGTPIYPAPLLDPPGRLAGPFPPSFRFAVASSGESHAFRDFSHRADLLILRGEIPVRVRLDEIADPEHGCFFAVRRVDGALLFCERTVAAVRESYGEAELDELVAKHLARVVPVRVSLT